MFNLLKVDDVASRLKLKPLETDRILRGTNPERGGLYDAKLFGHSRKFKFRCAYIDLGIKVLHPIFVEVARRNFDVVLDILRGTKFFNPQTKEISDDPSHLSGYIVFEKHFTDLMAAVKSRTSSGLTKKLADYFSKHQDRIFISKIVVIPAALRPLRVEKDRPIIDDLTLVYAQIAKIAHQLTGSSSVGTALPTVVLEKTRVAVTFMLHQLVRRLLTRIGTKAGLLRSSILGKRVDFSGRAVITVNPDIMPYQIGIPFRMAVRIFSPFLAYYFNTHPEDYKILREENRDVFERLRINILVFLDLVYKGLNISDTTRTILRKALEEICRDKYILAKRDPALHRSSVQAFRPVIVDSDTIQINPMVCSPYNADFDGDQMAVYLPITVEGQQAAEKLFFVNNWLAPGYPASVQYKPEKELIMGLYYITQYEPSDKEPKLRLEIGRLDPRTDKDLFDRAIREPDLTIRVVETGQNSTLGRAVVNSFLYPYSQVYVDAPITKKSAGKWFTAIAKRIANGDFSEEQLTDLAHRCENLLQYGRYIVTIKGKPHDLNDFILPPELEKKKKQLFAKAKDPESLEAASRQILEEFKDYLVKNGSFVVDMIQSGSRGNWTNVQQISLGKGYVADPTGKLVPEPILSSTLDGLKPTEFFNAGYGARKGIIDRSTNTRISGYLTRKLVYAAVTTKLSTKVCTPKKLFTIKITDLWAPMLVDRWIIDPVSKKDVLLTEDNIEKYINKTVQMYSPLYCKDKSGICRRCYGELYKVHKSRNIGVIAAQTIGERGSQLVMRTFHTGGKAELGDSWKDLLIDFNIYQFPYEKFFKYEKGKLHVLSNFTVEIHKDHITAQDDTSITADAFLLTDSKGNTHALELSRSLIFPVDEDDDVSEKKAILKLHPGDEISISLAVGDIVTAVTKADRLFNLTGVAYKSRITPESLVLKIARLYASQKVPLVHFEVIVSNMMRDPDDPEIPYRLGSMKKPPLYMGVKKVPFYESSVLGLCFEDVGIAVSTGLVKTTDTDSDLLELV